jgi:hypothetical protein
LFSRLTAIQDNAGIILARAFCRLDTGQQFSGKPPHGQGIGTLQRGSQVILGQYFNAVAGQNADVTEPEPKWLVSAVNQGNSPARECGAQQAPARSRHHLLPRQLPGTNRSYRH